MTTAIPAPVDYEPIDTVDDDLDDFEWPDDALDESQVGKLVADLWQLQLTELAWLDRIYEYTKGLRGIPEVPEGASDEVKELARLSVKNVLALVRDSFAQNLSVVGYRTVGATDNHPAWEIWQRNRMDARQAEVYRPALTYGAAYVTVLPGDDGPVLRTRSPRQLLAVYDDPVLDAWPQYAVEAWVTQKDAKPHRLGQLYDDKYVYELDFGALTKSEIEGGKTRPPRLRKVLSVTPHHAVFEGEPVCPVVRFVNARDADDMIVGEIAPLILLQQAINSVNFDRLIVCRFGANPQRVISGWTGSKDKVLKASALRVWTFEDPEVKAQAFPPASVEPYNAVLDEMLQHVAMVAQISPSQVTGKMINVSAEALAAAEANQQRKLAAKRESFGESWEQALRLAVAMRRATRDDEDDLDDDGELADLDGNGIPDDVEAEVIWRDTEARSFGAVVDGVTKLAGQGVPIEYLLPLVPGMTQQQITAIKQAIRGGNVKSLVDRLLQQPPPPPAEAPPLNEVRQTVDESPADSDDAGRS
ncbi:portal protein [Mycobacterium phage Henu3]|uniref:Portal protein n=1 Tax=Mycobacterium phage Henu3 TaxID=2492961 RepID=A0A410T7R7_9CAUD|nr:portal protein [Mycobacterium phage Henu3]QAU05024.1 portal protein [Mycobacterium phage Henu3]